MQRLLTESASLRGKTKVEHHCQNLGRTCRGSLADHGPVLAGQPIQKVRLPGEQPPGRRPVGVQARAEEPVDVGAVVGRAERSQPCRGLLLGRPHRQAQDRYPVIVTGPGVRSGIEQSRDHTERGGVRQHLGRGVRHLPPADGESAEQHGDRARIIVEDSGAQRPGPGDPGAPRE
jgi:hypothetical protein